LIYYSRTQLS